jgi:hypothetical protein
MIPITRVRAQPSAWTFTIPLIRGFVGKYVGSGIGWIDPFAGQNSPAEFRNDLDPATPAAFHMEAAEFCKMMTGPFQGVLFDPPYSYRQITEHYTAVGKKASRVDTSAQFYGRVMNAICDKVAVGGHALSFGWNSSGFGKRRGFEIVEILLVCHGSHHNDTICVVEKKIQGHLPIDEECGGDHHPDG